MSVLGFAAFMLAAIPVFWMKLGVLMSAFLQLKVLVFHLEREEKKKSLNNFALILPVLGSSSGVLCKIMDKRP